MKILALEKEVPGVNDGQFTDDTLKAEARKAWELYQSGVLRELYFTADKDEAVLVLKCESADEARRQLSELPLMRAGVAGLPSDSACSRIQDLSGCLHESRSCFFTDRQRRRRIVFSTVSRAVCATAGAGVGFKESYDDRHRSLRCPLPSSLFLRLRLRWSDHLFRDRRQQPVLVVVKIRLQHPRIPLEVLEHSVLPL